ncbi:MAG TPA: RNA-binding cell elongation regulator Jag/EloR [Clostridiales bacterium]|nr:RNA-binding cell elongation regulator Jag/EloR [Clostridiales bacterium]HPP35345.1 RNA-binding cell elongation regulator Jag/EloR [Clostridiales bacterium]
MSKVIETAGKTVDDAIEAALKQLGAEMDDVEVTVLEEGSKGLFGIGSRQARVQVRLKPDPAEEGICFLESVFEKMNVDVDIEKYEDEDSVLFKISGKDSGIIIGRRGETLDALQYLTSLVVNKSSKKYMRVTIDIENYREKREETLARLARRLADKVVKYRRNISLEPMNPYERRIIHSTLQNNEYVETYSVGEDPNRKVVITLKQAHSDR